MIDLMFLKHSAEQMDGIGYAEMTIEPKTVLALLDMLEAAQKDQARYQWLKLQKCLTLQHRPMQWTREDGSTFQSSHYLATNRTQHSELETLDATIDEAMTIYPATKGEA